MSAGDRQTEARRGVLRLPCLDEALAVREARRARRWLLASGVPPLYMLGTILLPWLVVPALYQAVSFGTGQTPLQDQPHWMFLTLSLTLVGGGMATAFARVSQLWHTERTRQTLEGWLLARQEPGPVVVTASLSGAALAVVVSLPGAVILAATALLLGIPARYMLLTLACLLAGALLGAATATAAFFMTTVSRSAERAVSGLGRGERENAHPLVGARFRVLFGPYRLAGACLVLLAFGIWLRIEAVEHGWGRPWEEHPGRLLLAVGLLTPAPVLTGFADRRWWVFRVVERLDFPILPESVALLLVVLYIVGTLVLLRWSEGAYRLLRAHPERDIRTVRSYIGEEADAIEVGSYWAGFANPVWTRELRTRLRGKEAPQFIFFASVALAVGGFTPLIAAASQLGDPLETARVARDVFFWLAMTLTAMIVLITPGLTAEGIGMERTRGTLELLLATPMKRPAILRGKLLGDLCVLALLVSPSLPLFGFCYLFHGAEVPQVVGVLLVLGLSALLCGLLGITASAIHPGTMAAKWQAYTLALLACGTYGGPLWLVNAISTPGSDSGPFAIVTPMLLMLYGPVLAYLWSRACERLKYAELGG